MFPFVRVIWHVVCARRQPPLATHAKPHISQHMCWPHDLEFWLELNNGRALTLYDIGRIAMAQRGGLIDALKRRRWGPTMAGSSTRFHRRIHGFVEFEMRSRAVCWDDELIYLEQRMWKTEALRPWPPMPNIVSQPF